MSLMRAISPTLPWSHVLIPNNMIPYDDAPIWAHHAKIRMTENPLHPPAHYSPLSDEDGMSPCCSLMTSRAWFSSASYKCCCCSIAFCVRFNLSSRLLISLRSDSTSIVLAACFHAWCFVNSNFSFSKTRNLAVKHLIASALSEDAASSSSGTFASSCAWTSLNS